MKNNTNSCIENYSGGYSKQLMESFETRHVNREAAFFLPNLKPGIKLLDCGCGPGTITIGLARTITPGEVIAIDKEEGQIGRSRANAEKEKVNNIDFMVGNVYELPFEDSTFDAAFAHTLLQHLKEPINALKEMLRVLKPGGVVGVRDDDRGALLIAPHNPQVEKLIELFCKHMEYNGGNPYVGRHHRELLRKAGFVNTKATASCSYHGTLEETKKCANLGSILAKSEVAKTAIDLGWTTSNKLRKLIKDSENWGNNPDAFEAIIMCEAVAWKENKE